MKTTKTTIQVQKATIERLKKVKVAKRESYEEIVNRLLDVHSDKV